MPPVLVYRTSNLSFLLRNSSTDFLVVVKSSESRYKKINLAFESGNWAFIGAIPSGLVFGSGADVDFCVVGVENLNEFLAYA